MGILLETRDFKEGDVFNVLVHFILCIQTTYVYTYTYVYVTGRIV